MTWRKFLVRLGGLSSGSRYVAALTRRPQREDVLAPEAGIALLKRAAGVAA